MHVLGRIQSSFLDNVQCQGTDESVLQCPANPSRVHNCGSHETAGVVCVDSASTTTTIG